MKDGVVLIHGKEYTTVAKRIETAHANKKLTGVSTEVLSHNPVVVKATVVIEGNIYTGTSSVNLDTTKLIEQQNPYEVAETSAVGRALGFAGFGTVDSVESADGMHKASYAPTAPIKTTSSTSLIDPKEVDEVLLKEQDLLPATITHGDKIDIITTLGATGKGIKELNEYVEKIFKKDSYQKLTHDEARTLIERMRQGLETGEALICEVCGEAAEERWVKTKAGKSYHGIFCSTKDRSHTKFLTN